MGVISELSTALRTLRDNPIVVVPALLVGLVGQFSSAVQFLPDAAGLLVLPLLFVYPLLQGMLVGGPYRGQTQGTVTFGEILEAGTENYLSMLGAILVLVLLGAGIGIVLAFVFLFVVFAAAASGSVVLPAVVGLVVFLAVLLVAMFLQFVDTAIVVSGESALDGITTSVSLVRGNFLGVLGFSIVYTVVNLLAQAPVLALQFSSFSWDFEQLAEQSAQQPGFEQMVASPELFAASITVALTVGTVVTAYLFAYKVAYYRTALEPDLADLP